MTQEMKRVRIGPHGRAVIPAEFRRRLGVGPGDDLVSWLEGDRLIFRAREAVERELWDMAAGIEGSLSDELIGERRREAKREG